MLKLLNHPCPALVVAREVFAVEAVQFPAEVDGHERAVGLQTVQERGDDAVVRRDEGQPRPFFLRREPRAVDVEAGGDGPREQRGPELAEDEAREEARRARGHERRLAARRRAHLRGDVEAPLRRQRAERRVPREHVVDGVEAVAVHQHVGRGHDDRKTPCGIVAVGHERHAEERRAAARARLARRHERRGDRGDRGAVRRRPRERRVDDAEERRVDRGRVEARERAGVVVVEDRREPRVPRGDVGDAARERRGGGDGVAREERDRARRRAHEQDRAGLRRQELELAQAREPLPARALPAQLPEAQGDRTGAEGRRDGRAPVVLHRESAEAVHRCSDAGGRQPPTQVDKYLDAPSS